MTATEKYHAVQEGKLSEAEFVRQMRQAFPQYITQWNGYKDSVSILKSKSMIFEKKESPKKDIEALADNFSINVIERGIDIELEAKGIDSTGTVSKEEYIAAKRKAISNLQKDQNHYINLMSGESSKVDKNDKMKETKRGAKDKDTFNDLKKATLKEVKEVMGVNRKGEKQPETEPSRFKGRDKSRLREETMDLISYLKKEKGADNEMIKDFIKTHFQDIRGMSLDQIGDEFDEFVSVNYEHPSDYMQQEVGGVDRLGHKKEEDDEVSALSQAKEKIWAKEAMDDATMDAIKNYKPGSLKDEPHSYKPGDMFTTDFDYEGMLKAGLKIRINTPVETMQAIYDSFEDVNYHRENAHLGNVIDAVKAGDKSEALDSLRKFRKEVKETLSGIFEGAFPVRERDEDYVPKNGAVVSERVGGLQEFISLIQDRAADSGFSEEEEAQEVIEALQAHYNLSEAKGKDHDGDGDIDGDDYMAAKDKAIKKAMGKDEMVKENLKAIISKVLEEGTINEAATNELARIADEYAGFEGMKGAILDLQNLVSDIEAYYDKTREKIQKTYDKLGEIRNEEGLKVGGFLAPAIEAAFMKDLRPVTKQGFTKGLDQPKVRVISQADIDAHNSGDRPLGEAEPSKETVFTPNI